MTHLAAAPRSAFSVQVQLHVLEPAGGGPVRLAVFPELAEQVGHGSRTGNLRRPKGQTAYGAYLLLELTGDRAVERQVTRIVRTRRQFVDEQLAVGAEEKLHAEHADVLELLEDGPSDFLR